jgi:hypothetical protein
MKRSEGQAGAASAKARADFARGEISASVLLPATPERVFRALTSAEICDWWVRPGVFDTREWRGDLRVGGRWEAAGVGGGQPYRLDEHEADRRKRRAEAVEGKFIAGQISLERRACDVDQGNAEEQQQPPSRLGA